MDVMASVNMAILYTYITIQYPKRKVRRHNADMVVLVLLLAYMANDVISTAVFLNLY